MLRYLMQRLRIFSSPQEMMRAARAHKSRDERGEGTVKRARYTYTDGPAYYMGQWIVEQMRLAGYPSKIYICFRPAEVQAKRKAQGRSKAPPWSSPHQYYEAVDIVHETLYWEASQAFWDTLAAVVRNAEKHFDVDLVHGYDWGWDSAHIEIADWRKVRKKIRPFKRPPNEIERWQRFVEVLPKIAKDAVARGVAPSVSV